MRCAAPRHSLGKTREVESKNQRIVKQDAAKASSTRRKRRRRTRCSPCSFSGWVMTKVTAPFGRTLIWIAVLRPSLSGATLNSISSPAAPDSTAQYQMSAVPDERSTRRQSSVPDGGAQYKVSR
eukprot:3941562-Rhodomonas_salina.3